MKLTGVHLIYEEQQQIVSVCFCSCFILYKVYIVNSLE